MSDKTHIIKLPSANRNVFKDTLMQKNSVYPYPVLCRIKKLSDSVVYLVCS